MSSEPPSAGTLLLGDDGRYALAGPVPKDTEPVYQALCTLTSAAEQVPATLIARLAKRDVFDVHASLGLLELAGRVRARLCPVCPGCSAAGAGFAVGVSVPFGAEQTCNDCGRDYLCKSGNVIILYGRSV